MKWPSGVLAATRADRRVSESETEISQGESEPSAGGFG
jgi:hypothetical protein